MQFDEVSELMVQGDVILLLARLHTAVAIDSAYFIENVNITPHGGGAPINSFTLAKGVDLFLLSLPPSPSPPARRTCCCRTPCAISVQLAIWRGA